MLTAHRRFAILRRVPGAEIEARPGLVVVCVPEGAAAAICICREWAVSPAVFEDMPLPVMAASGARGGSAWSGAGIMNPAAAPAGPRTRSSPRGASTAGPESAAWAASWAAKGQQKADFGPSTTRPVPAI